MRVQRTIGVYRGRLSLVKLADTSVNQSDFSSVVPRTWETRLGENSAKGKLGTT